MKKGSLFLSLVVIIAMLFSSCGGASTEVAIGQQVWMTKNLNVDKFRNGDFIPEAKTDEEWEKACNEGQPVWCYFDNDSSMGEKYGKLYNWYAVNDKKGLAPEGYAIPTNEDWSILINFLGGASLAGDKMKFTEFWADNEGRVGRGNNKSGFSGLPGGGRISGEGFFDFGTNGWWWSADEVREQKAWYVHMYYLHSDVGIDSTDKQCGFSVRCLRY
jgi:uncharacterized protein (TIGR02145 family)